MEKTEINGSEVSASPQGRTRTERVLAIFSSVFLLACVACACFLTILYNTIGDRTAWGEYLTIWPPVLWLLLLVPLAVMSWERARWRRWLIAPGSIAAFALLALECRSLVRFGGLPDREDGAIRVVTWNVASGDAPKDTILSELAAQKPDICFLQETPDGDKSFLEQDLIGHWDGFHWIDFGDCGILSRHPIHELPTEPVGPWEAPLLCEVQIDEATRVLLVDVRLMLPSLILNPFPTQNRKQLVLGNRVRVAQFPALRRLIDSTMEETNIEHVILAGDFNTDASARSLVALRPLLRDIWPRSGRGWGGTITTNFPIGRIDQVHVTSNIIPDGAVVVKSAASDHRMVVCDLVISR